MHVTVKLFAILRERLNASSLDLDLPDGATVATAIEQLGRTSRVVGIVTHVRDLAERIPVRYEVRKGPTTSVVEKVLA